MLHYQNIVIITGLKTSPYGSAYSDPNEAKVYKKLDELNQLLNSATELKPNDPSANNSDKECFCKYSGY